MDRRDASRPKRIARRRRCLASKHHIAAARRAAERLPISVAIVEATDSRKRLLVVVVQPSRATRALVVSSFDVTARAKLLGKILSGSSSQNISFDELVGLLQHLGFAMRISGSHRIFSREGVAEILNLQPRKDGTAKPYQLRQVRNVIVRYNLAGADDGS